MSRHSFPMRTARAGFSLIELVVTMSILIIIAGVVVPQFSQFGDRANDARRVADLVSVEKALEAYRLQYGTYPTTGGAWRGDAPSYGGLGYDAAGYIPGLVPEFVKELPRDPSNAYPAGGSGYLYRSDGTDYKFLAHATPNEYPADHRFYDARRPTHAYQVSSAGGANW